MKGVGVFWLLVVVCLTVALAQDIDMRCKLTKGEDADWGNPDHWSSDLPYNGCPATFTADPNKVVEIDLTELTGTLTGTIQGTWANAVVSTKEGIVEIAGSFFVKAWISTGVVTFRSDQLKTFGIESTEQFEIEYDTIFENVEFQAPDFILSAYFKGMVPGFRFIATHRFELSERGTIDVKFDTNILSVVESTDKYGSVHLEGNFIFRKTPACHSPVRAISLQSPLVATKGYCESDKIQGATLDCVNDQYHFLADNFHKIVWWPIVLSGTVPVTASLATIVLLNVLLFVL